MPIDRAATAGGTVSDARAPQLAPKGPASSTPTGSYIEMLRKAARARPDGSALIVGSERRSYADLMQRASWRAREFRALGLKAGDRLGLLMPNGVEFVELLIGAAMLGIVTVPMNIRFRSVETAHVVADSQMTAIYTTDAIEDVTNFRELLHDALPGLRDAADPLDLKLAAAPHLRAVVQLGKAQAGFVDPVLLRRLAVSRPPPADGEGPDAEAPLLMMYTSGTTANPKACVLSSRALVANAEAIADRFRIAAEDVWWCPLPMFHVGGLLFMTVMFARAGLYVGMSHFNVEATFDIVERMRPTVFYPLFPTITLALIDHPRFAATCFASVRYVFSVAPADVQRKIQAAFPSAALFSAYGMTETCGTVTFNTLDDGVEARMTTCGSPLPGWEFRIVDPETRVPVPPGSPGEIEVRGVGLFSGYFNEPALTAASFAPDGFLRTGDIGALDGDGRLGFRGRLKDQLKVGGENVSALEVESFLAGHPAVKQAQVVGTPDARYGEVPVAFIELMSGASLTEAEVVAWCTGRIARYKIPRHVRFVTEWPMSATKILKHRLRDRIAGELAAGERVLAGGVLIQAQADAQHS